VEEKQKWNWVKTTKKKYGKTNEMKTEYFCNWSMCV
jgi:hypothetical protein